MDYESLLKLGLRHRPDNVFIIGEIRDSQTAAMSVQAALSGHLVFGNYPCSKCLWRCFSASTIRDRVLLPSASINGGILSAFNSVDKWRTSFHLMWPVKSSINLVICSMAPRERRNVWWMGKSSSAGCGKVEKLRRILHVNTSKSTKFNQQQQANFFPFISSGDLLSVGFSIREALGFIKAINPKLAPCLASIDSRMQKEQVCCLPTEPEARSKRRFILSITISRKTW